MKKVKDIIIKSSNESKNSRLFENIISLGLLQGVNYILPLMTIPYLFRVLGPDIFGLIAFASATIMYIALLTDYGFNLSATRQISISREDNKRVSDIFSSVMYIKIAMLLVGFVFTLVLIATINKFGEHWEVYILTFGTVVGQVLFPIWLFQGIEQMKYITYINIASKSLFTLLIFMYVRSESDYMLVPFFNSLGAILAGVLSLCVVRKNLVYRFIRPEWAIIKYQLKDGWHVFFSSIAISLYTVSSIFILGLLTNNAVVGQFAAVDKIIQAVKGVYQPISQAIFPMIGKKFHNDKKTAFEFVIKFTVIVIFLMTLLSVMLFVFSDLIVNLILGNEFTDAVTLLKVMSPLPLIIALSNILGVQIMLNLGLKAIFSKILTAAAFIGVALSFLLVPVMQGIGSAYTLLIVESFVTAAFLICVCNHFKSISNK